MPVPQRSFRLKAFHCTVRGCRKRCSTPSGLQRHIQTIHEIPRALRPPSTLPLISTSQHSEHEATPSVPSSPLPHPSPHRSSRGSPSHRVSQPASPHGQAPHPRHLKIMTHPIIDGQFKFSTVFIYSY